jgi:hypothetical protein
VKSRTADARPKANKRQIHLVDNAVHEPLVVVKARKPNPVVDEAARRQGSSAPAVSPVEPVVPVSLPPIVRANSVTRDADPLMRKLVETVATKDLEKFSGSDDQEFDEWIKMFETKVGAESEETKLVIFSSLLTGMAKHVYEGLTSEAKKSMKTTIEASDEVHDGNEGLRIIQRPYHESCASYLPAYGQR